MVELLWVKMPSFWITNGSMATDFSSSRHVSTDIAALKVYIYLCLYATPVKRAHKLTYLALLPKKARAMDVVTQAECCLTYDDIAEGCFLSRKLISAGLKKLIEKGMILKEGTTRKPRYIIQGSFDFGWAKLPKRGLIKVNHEIAAFGSMKNRYKYERDALKLFLYLLSIRANTFSYVDVSRGTISNSTGVELFEIDNSLGYLQGIGLLEEVKDKGTVLNSNHFEEKSRLHRYYVVSSSGLVQPKSKSRNLAIGVKSKED